MRRALALIALCTLWSTPVLAHRLVLSVLQVRELSPGEYTTSWQRLQGAPDARAAYLLLRPVFPDHCRFSAPRLSCGARGLAGRLGFLGLSEISSSAVMEIEPLGAARETYAFNGSASQVVRAAPAQRGSGLAIVKSFVGLGVEHIMFGWDHLAFVLCLLWLVASRWMLVKTITAFTLGHSITLTAASLGFSAVPAAPVEASIALSIVIVAAEVVRCGNAPRATLTARAPWLVALAFGLLHGFGFANALREAEIARADLPFALLGFNLGVELGQLTFVAFVLGLAGLSQRVLGERAHTLRPVMHYAVGALAASWLIERIATFAP